MFLREGGNDKSSANKLYDCTDTFDRFVFINAKSVLLNTLIALLELIITPWIMLPV